MDYRINLLNDNKDIISYLNVSSESMQNVMEGCFDIRIVYKDENNRQEIKKRVDGSYRQSIDLLKRIIESYYTKSDKTLWAKDMVGDDAEKYPSLTNAWKDLRNFINRSCIEHNYHGSVYEIDETTYFRARYIEISNVDSMTYLDITAVTDNDSEMPNPILEYMLSKGNNVTKREEVSIRGIKKLLDTIEMYREIRDDKTEVINALIKLKRTIDSLPKAETEFARNYYRYRRITMSYYIAHSLKNRQLVNMYHSGFPDFNDNAFSWFYLARNLSKSFAMDVLNLGSVEEIKLSKESFVFEEPEQPKEEDTVILCKARMYTDLAMVAWGCENMKMYAKDTLHATAEDFIQEALNYITASLPCAKSDIRYYDNVLRDYGVILENYAHDYSRGHSYQGSRNMFTQIEKIYQLSKEKNQEIHLNINHKNFKVLLSLYDKRINELLNESAFGLASDRYLKVFYSKNDTSLTYEKFKELWENGLNENNRSEIKEINEKIGMYLKEMSDCFIDNPRMFSRYQAVYYRNLKMMNKGLSEDDDKKLKAALTEYKRIKEKSSVRQMLEITCNSENDCVY